jgi:hypothetical protein
MSKLVKTGKEISEGKKNLLECTYENTKKLDEHKFLILPAGLDALEEMLRKRFGEEGFDEDMFEIVSSVFARFKKDQDL